LTNQAILPHPARAFTWGRPMGQIGRGVHNYNSSNSNNTAGFKSHLNGLKMKGSTSQNKLHVLNF